MRLRHLLPQCLIVLLVSGCHLGGVRPPTSETAETTDPADPTRPIAGAKRPSILLIMSDDMGWSDLGCYGGEIETPRLDSLASNGLRFTQFYNGARCCPTRASLMTGVYAHQAGMGAMTEDHGEPGYRGELSQQTATIAEVLREAGYRTYMIGKWHLTQQNGPGSDKFNWPLQRGFDRYYGLIWGVSSQFDPAVCRDNTYYTCENDPGYKPDGDFYFTNALSDNAVQFIKDHGKDHPQSPFFMYVAYTAAHWPMHALEKDIEKYKGRYDAGYDAVRQARLEKLKRLGLLDPRWTPAPTVLDWDDVEDKAWETRCMEVYAAMIDTMDRGIGRIVDELERQGRLDDTLILFLQDNGACAEGVGRQPNLVPPDTLRPLGPNDLPAGGHPKQTRDGRPVREGPGVMPGPADTYVAYGEGWANVSNTPFRRYKRWDHEGGISTPLIVHWPASIPESRRNTFVNDPSHLIDIMATCVDVAGARFPTERNGQPTIPMQGVSLRPAIEGAPLERKEPLFWEHIGNRAVRDGQWKLVAMEDQPWELYDVEADRGETRNLASVHPEKVRELEAKWNAWAERSKVLPLGAWKKPMRVKEPKSTQTVFRLKQGDALSREQGPVCRNRRVAITADIAEPGTEGVLAAQGGRAHGYSLHIKEGRPAFSIRREGQITSISALNPLPPEACRVQAVIEKDGAMRLLVNDAEVAVSETGGPMAITPIDGLTIGYDGGDPVGNYAGTFLFNGKLVGVVIDVTPAE